MDIEEFKVRLEGVRGKSARCPAHDDRHASLTFDVGEGEAYSSTVTLVAASKILSNHWA